MTITLSKLRRFEKQSLVEVLATKDKVAITEFLNEWGLTVTDKKIVPQEQYSRIWKELYGYYDKQQLVKKINLNSASTNPSAFN